MSSQLRTDPSPSAPYPSFPRGRGTASVALIEGRSAWGFQRGRDKAWEEPWEGPLLEAGASAWVQHLCVLESPGPSKARVEGTSVA